MAKSTPDFSGIPLINDRINRILEIEEKINEIYIKHVVDEAD